MPKSQIKIDSAACLSRQCRSKGDQLSGMSLGRPLRALIVTMAITAVSAQGVAAYTFQENNFDAGQPQGCTNRYDSATGQYWWCRRWPLTPNGYSTHIYMYLDPSLGSRLPGETLNFTTVISNAMSRWNAVPANNPYLHTTTAKSSASGYATTGGDYYSFIERSMDVPPDAYAWEWDYTPDDLGISGDTHTVIASFIQVSDIWSFKTKSSSYPAGWADADSVIAHELGHTEGLGHTNYNVLMYPFWDASHDLISPSTASGGEVPGLQVFYNKNFCMTCQY